jgi:hypothetical protein
VPSQHVFLRNAVGDLIQYWWVNYLGWNVENMTTRYQGEPMIGDPVAVLGNESGNDGVREVHVLAPGSGARLLHYHWLNHQGWQYRGDATGSSYGVATSRISAIRGAVSATSGPNFSVFGRPNIALDPLQLEMRGCCVWRVGPTAP